MRDPDERDFSALCPFLDRSRGNAEELACSGFVHESSGGLLVAWRHALSSPRSKALDKDLTEVPTSSTGGRWIGGGAS